MKKMCWFCSSFTYEVEDLAMGSAWTGEYGENFGLGCSKGLWEFDIREDSKVTFAQNLQRAEYCEDFMLNEKVEREINRPDE